MASIPPQLIVVYSRPVRRELGEIWDWNAINYGADHATAYVRYLEDCIIGLGVRFADGRPMAKRPHLMKITFRRSRKLKSNAHTVVYRVDEAAGTVTIVHVFHTARDIEGILGTEGT